MRKVELKATERPSYIHDFASVKGDILQCASRDSCVLSVTGYLTRETSRRTTRRSTGPGKQIPATQKGLLMSCHPVHAVSH